MDAVTGPFDWLQDVLGGGNLTLWLVLGGLVLVWLAVRAVKLAVKLALAGLALAVVLGTAPWGGQAAEGAVSDCAEAAVAEAASGWQTNLTKRVTAEEISPDATCEADGVGLATGSALVRLRTFYDLPFQTWDVTPDGAVARLDLPAG